MPLDWTLHLSLAMANAALNGTRYFPVPTEQSTEVVRAVGLTAPVCMGRILHTSSSETAFTFTTKRQKSFEG